MRIDNLARRLKKLIGKPEPFDVEGGLAQLRADFRRMRLDPVERLRLDVVAAEVEDDARAYREGREALENKDYTAAELALRRAASNGHDEAAYWLWVLVQSQAHQHRSVSKPEDAAQSAVEAVALRLRSTASGTDRIFCGPTRAILHDMLPKLKPKEHLVAMTSPCAAPPTLRSPLVGQIRYMIESAEAQVGNPGFALSAPTGMEGYVDEDGAQLGGKAEPHGQTKPPSSRGSRWRGRRRRLVRAACSRAGVALLALGAGIGVACTAGAFYLGDVQHRLTGQSLSDEHGHLQAAQSTTTSVTEGPLLTAPLDSSFTSVSDSGSLIPPPSGDQSAELSGGPAASAERTTPSIASPPATEATSRYSGQVVQCEEGQQCAGVPIYEGLPGEQLPLIVELVPRGSNLPVECWGSTQLAEVSSHSSDVEGDGKSSVITNKVVYYFVQASNGGWGWIASDLVVVGLPQGAQLPSC